MKRRGRPPYPELLTPRQQEVLDLLRQGLTDREIAERLGISLQGARFHVSEILARTGVESRHEAARLAMPVRRWWSLGPVMALAAAPLRRLHWPAWLSPLATGGILLAAAATIAGFTALVLATRDGGSSPDSAAIEASPSVAAQPSPPAVSGLFTDPRPTTLSGTRSLGDQPAQFSPWDRSSTMVYDVVDGTETNLGPGSLRHFSPDSTRMVWVAGANPDEVSGGEVWMIDLATQEKRDLGPGRVAVFIDNDRVGIALPDSNMSQVFDLRSGQRGEVQPGIWQPDNTVTTPEGYELQKERRTGSYPFLENHFNLVDPGSGNVLLEFDGYQAAPAGPGTLVVATAPTLSGAPDERGFRNGTVNIFLVDIVTGRANFVATSEYFEGNWPLAADADYVLWTEDYCGDPEGKTRLYDRHTGTITEVNASLWATTFTPGGLIASGPFGAGELIDPATLQYTAVIPRAGDSSWSPDYRYASLGMFGGHGGLCP